MSPQFDTGEPEFRAPEGLALHDRIGAARGAARAATRADFEAFLGTRRRTRYGGAGEAVERFYFRLVRGSDPDTGFDCQPVLAGRSLMFRDLRTRLPLFEIDAPRWAVDLSARVPRPARYACERLRFLLPLEKRLRSVRAATILRALRADDVRLV
jgi:hypothetical protein